MTDDAAVYRLDDEHALIQTVDFFPPVVDDAWTYGAIAAANAMSDVYAMGGEVALALNIAAFPENLPIPTMSAILQGGAEKFAEGGGVIAGGHTVLDDEPKYGLSVTGFVHPAQVMTKAGARSGDLLVLTKALGTGVILTAAKEERAAQEHFDAAVASMLRLNRHASHLAREVDAHALTDVTGFALIGHALEIADHSRVRIVLRAGGLPLLPGALDYVAAGVDFGGLRRNREYLEPRVQMSAAVPEDLQTLLFDPQTSGGLLMAVDASKAQALVERLVADGHAAAVVGEVRSGTGLQVEL